MTSKWKIYRIKDVLSYVVDNRGKTPPIQDEGFELLEVNAISATEKFPQYQLVRKHVSEHVYNTWFRSGHPQIGDILVPTVGTLGAVSYVNKDNCCIAQNLIALRANKDICDCDYLYYILRNPNTRKRLLNLNIGGVQPSIKVPHLMELEITLPDIDTQRKISNILKAIDDKISTNQKINDNLQQQAIALYKSWFVDFAPFGGAMPIGWNISSLGESTEMGAGGDKPKLTSPIKTEECPYPIFSNGLSDYGLYGYTNEAKIHAESVTVSARGTIGFVCLRHIPYVPIVRLVTLIPKRELMSAKYLYLYLRQLNISGTGTTQQQLTVPDFRKTEIVIPDKDTMTAFTALITPMFEKMWANEEENDSLAKIRDALLPKLMSGEIDVSSIQI